MSAARQAAPDRRFRSASQAWIWAALLLAARRDGRAPREREGGDRPCTPDDVLRAVAQAHAAGRLSLEQAAVMRRWGERGEEPSPAMLGEAEDWKAWRAAMAAIEPALVARGIVSPRRARGWVR